MALIVSPKIVRKINDKHNVTKDEVEQCFMNRAGPYLTDEREQHTTRTGAPTLWFVGETDTGRPLKIVFVLEHPNVYLRTAFQPTEKQKQDYLDTISA